MIKDDVLQYLKDNLYIIQQGDSWVISNKFTRELGISPSNTVSIASSSIIKPILKPGITTKEVYKQFIQDAEIPSRITTNSGSFWCNRYSEPGFKAFKRVWDDPKINRSILLAATKWYYKQINTARKMVGNYFSEGIWESCYDDFVKVIEGRKKEPKDYEYLEKILPKVVDENASNMEQG